MIVLYGTMMNFNQGAKDRLFFFLETVGGDQNSIFWHHLNKKSPEL